MKQLIKYLVLLITGGGVYVVIELLWRGHSHWTMLFLGGLCFICCGLINDILPWSMPFALQIVIGVAIVTILEFVAGGVINLVLEWNVWDYSDMSGNILGQICPQYILLWIPLVAIAIILDDWLRYWWFSQERPHYRLL